MFAVTLIVHLGFILAGLGLIVKVNIVHGFHWPSSLAAIFLAPCFALLAVYLTFQAHAESRMSVWGLFFTVNFGAYFFGYAFAGIVLSSSSFRWKTRWTKTIAALFWLSAGSIPIIWFEMAENWRHQFAINTYY